MKRKNDLRQKLIIIQLCTLFLFLGSCGLFYILRGGGDVIENDPDNSTSHHYNTDTIPDIISEDIINNRLEAYDKANSIIAQEQKDKELQEEHNSFLFFTEKTDQEESITSNVSDTIETALQTFKRTIVHHTPRKESNEVSCTSPKTSTKNETNYGYDEFDIEKEKEKEKKDRLERLRSLYMNPSSANNENEITKEENIVSTPVQDKTVEQTPKNGFRPINSSNKKENKGQIRAVIHGEQKNVTSSSQVSLRILEPIVINGTTIPENTIVIGKASFSQNRVNIHIENIVYKDNVFPFKGTIYDRDGFKGIYSPENLVNDVQKEAGSETVTNSDIRLGNVSGIISTGANAIINATKNVINGSVRDVKVTLAANYNLIIKIDE